MYLIYFLILCYKILVDPAAVPEISILKQCHAFTTYGIIYLQIRDTIFVSGDGQEGDYDVRAEQKLLTFVCKTKECGRWFPPRQP